LEFKYQSSSSTGSRGDVILSPNYDASEPAPTTEVGAVDDEGTMTFNIWTQTVTLRLDQKAMMGSGPRKYVRAIAMAGDIKTYDVGTLTVATNNCFNTDGVGKLFVDYDIEFFVPQRNSFSVIMPSTVSVFQNDSQTFTTATQAVAGWSTVGLDALNWFYNYQPGGAGGGTFYPPAGNYRVTFVGNFLDVTDEDLTVAVTFKYNGTAIGNASVVKCLSFASGTQCVVPLDYVFFARGFPSYGFAVYVTMTGTAGTLTLAAASLVVQVV